MPSRRDLLRGSGVVGLAALSGCSRLPLVPRPRLSLVVLNETERELETVIELVRPDGVEYSEAIAYRTQLDLAAPAEATGAPDRRELDGVVGARRYLVRVWLGDAVGTPVGEYRYYPDCSGGMVAGDGDDLRPRVRIEFGDASGRASPAVHISQTRCSDDSFWY